MAWFLWALCCRFFGLFPEVERGLFSEPTKEVSAAARAKGRMLGRPKGSLGTSELDGRDEESELFKKGVSKARIARIMGVYRTAFSSSFALGSWGRRPREPAGQGQKPHVEAHLPPQSRREGYPVRHEAIRAH